jgi:taspase (threonine aspartase 1)
MEKRLGRSFVAVHVGAGYHSMMREPQFNAACSKACDAAMSVLRNGGDALQACVEAVKVLEDDPVTNAGTGSSLNRDGFVECDAALMDGRSGLFGSVGAVPCTMRSKLHD